jgi:hypothetical protein
MLENGYQYPGFVTSEMELNYKVRNFTERWYYFTTAPESF